MISAANDTNTVTYTYNAQGIRIDANDGTNITKFLIDPYNHTGYAQVFKSDDGTDEVTYILGSDIIAQATNTNDPVYFLYDGHGSVRFLADSDGALISGQSFNYDAYGNLLGSVTPQTSLLYAGEWWDADATQYYLWARWYSPVTGRFNRFDPYGGNNQDPQSLHKYLYVHNNPVNGIDPTGNFEFSLVGTLFSCAEFIMRVIDSLLFHIHVLLPFAQ